MKRNLGSFLVLLFFSLTIDASTYTWSSFVAKDKAYVGEAVYLKYLCEFDDDAELYIIDFNPRSNDLYDLILLSKDESIRDGKRINSYEYILKAKYSQTLEVALEATVKQTSLDSIVENTTNHYDDTKFDSIHKETMVTMDTITLEVLDTPKELVGSFKLEVKKDEINIKAYEPYHVDIEVSGNGNFDALKALDFDIKNVKVFAQKPIKNVALGKDGYKGTWIQKFAFVGGEDFSIPSRSIDYFDTSSQKIETLKIEGIEVRVKSGYKKSELLDEVEEGFSFNFTYVYYFLTLVAGFLVGKINFSSKRLSTELEAFIAKVKNATSFEALSMLLILRDEQRFKDILTQIDTNQFKSLSQAKKTIIKSVS